MILVSQEKIKEYTEKGFWGTKTLLDLFKENVAANKERLALVDPPNRGEFTNQAPERITYEDLSKRVDALATSLMNRGIGKDDIVQVQLPNIWELTLVYMAIARVGAIFTPMPVQWRAHEFGYINRITKAKMFITVERFHGFKHTEMAWQMQPDLPHLKHLLTLEEVREMSLGEAHSSKLDAILVDADDILTLCWSSGTESNPKGCPMSHNNWFSQGGIINNALDSDLDHEIILCIAPMVNMTGVGVGFILWLLTGGTVVFHHPLDVEMVIQQILDEGVTRTILVPAVLNILLKHPKVDQFDLSSVDSILTGSAPPSAWSLREFQRRWGIEIACAWGQTEGTAIMVGPKDIPDIEKRVCMFPDWGDKSREWPIKGIETKLVDPMTNEVVTKVGQIGQMAYKGPNVFPGYYKSPDINERSFDDEDFFYTGDLFKLEGDGFFSFFDRCKDIIIRGGINISAQEVENMLLAHPKVLDVAAVGMPDEVLGERTCVYVVPRDRNDVLDIKGLVEYMKEKGLATYKLPERMEQVDIIPRNPVGKILKSELRKDITAKLRAE